MKKGLIFSLIICIVSFLGLAIFPIIPKNDFSINVSTNDQFDLSLAAELQNDDYSYTEIDKNITLNQLKEKIKPNDKNDNYVTTFGIDNKNILTYNQILNYCTQNDFILKETNDKYLIRNKFSLMRLIVNGKLPNSHQANKVLTNDDMHILCYNTIEDTKKAYQSMIANNVNVSIDFIISAESEEVVQAQSLLNNWSETAIDLAAYTDYNKTKQIVVAVLDTGINTLHEMFANRLLTSGGKVVGYSYYTSNYSYNDTNLQTRTSGSTTYSFEDDHGHGSHVAGIIVSQTPSNVKILPIRILGSDGKGSYSAITTALEKVYSDYSNTYNICCTNLSLGGEVTQGFEQELENFNTAFNKLKSKNILSVAAAGNDSKNVATYLPAACDESAIIVSSFKSGYIFDSTNSHSNFGSTIDICAPGALIYSAHKAEKNSASTANQYATLSGTSMATPHVSACVALLCLDNDYYSSNNATATYTASEIESRIYKSALDLGSHGKDDYYGWGALSYTNIDTLQQIVHTATNTITTYDGNYHNISIVVTKPTSNYTIKYSLENDNTYTITNITSNSAFKNATNGEMTIYYQISAPGYETITGNKTLTINKRTLTYNLSNQTSTYGNATHIKQNSSTLVLKSGSVVNGDNLNLKLTTTANINSSVGNYPITLTHSNNANYLINSNSATLTIHPKSVTINIGNSSSTYGDAINLENVSVSVVGLVGGDKINNIVISTIATSSSSVNTYPITATYSPNSNYSVTINNGSYSITPKSATINIGNLSSIYGNAINLENISISVVGLVGNDTINNITPSTTATSSSPVNTYPISATYDQNNNYSVSINSGILTISPREITILITNQQISNQTIEYGDELKLDENSYEIKSGSILNSDKTNFKINLTSTIDPNNENSYLVSATSTNSNYKITLQNNQINVVPRKLKISIQNQTFEYGENIVLDNSKYLITDGSFAFDEQNSVVLSTNATSSSNIGEYNITLSFDNMDKYELSIISGKVIINKKEIKISTHQFKTYGEETNLNGDIYNIEEGNIVNNDDLELNFTTTATKTSTIGDYLITLISANPNYDVTLTNSYLTITPKTIQITLLNQESVYGDKVVINNSKYTLDESQIVEASFLNISLYTNATNKSNVGNYPITASTDNVNYELDYENGIYNITKRKLSIRVYNQSTPHTFNLTYNKEDYDLMSGSVVNGDELNIELHTNATAFSFAGDYELMATYANENYDITFTDATLTLEFSYVDALMIVVPALVLIIVATIALIIVIKRKNKTNPLYKKWTK